MINKQLTINVLVFIFLLVSGTGYAEEVISVEESLPSETDENFDSEERISDIGVIAPAVEPALEQIEAMTSTPVEIDEVSQEEGGRTSETFDDELDSNDTVKKVNIDKKESKTKKIQESIAGAIDPKLLDAEEYKAADWPMRVPKIPVKFDWVLLKKGELFGGDLTAMYQDKVEFDSDEVGIISIDMEDILQIRTKTIMSVRFLDDSIIWGKVVITDKEVFFIDSPDRAFDRRDILTISPAKEEGQSLWDGEISVGLNFKTGNSARFDYLLSAQARRLSSSGRFTMSYEGIYAEVENVETGDNVSTENNHRLNIGYDYFSTKKMYYRLPYFEYYSDPFKNIDVQSTLGVAVGYEVVDRKIWNNQDIELNVYAGPSVQYTRFSEVQVGVEDESKSPVLAAGFDFDFDLTNDMEFFFIYDGKVLNKESGAFISYLKVGVEIEVVDDFDIEIATIVDYIAEPTANELGEVPESTDTLLAISLEYDF